MNFQGKDGKLRIQCGTTKYAEILFTDMNFTAPTARPRTDETLIMNRGRFDSDAHYVQSDDEPRYAPLDMSFSCRLADTINSRGIAQLFSGVSNLNTGGAASGTTRLYTMKGTTSIDGNTLPEFNENSGGVTAKLAYHVEVLWDGVQDFGMKYNEVWFKPGQSTITESKDGLTLNVKGLIYGEVTRIWSFTAGLTQIL
jgi:hypothetical protein